jgi:hypothetical protein
MRRHPAHRGLPLLLALGLLAPGCGGDDEPTARIAFDGLDDGASLAPTSASTLVTSGTAWLIQGGYPAGGVDWQSGAGSGTAPLDVDCFLVCRAHWSASVPLALGVNIVTFKYLDAAVRLTVIRYPVMVVSGRVALASTGAGVPDVLIRLDGSTARTGPGGDYSFGPVPPGTQRITASLPAPQSGSCFDLLPTSRLVEATATDVPGQDFIATELSPCYGISGRITPSTDPAIGIAGIRVEVADAGGATLSTFTDEGGTYAFDHLAPGAYTVTPSDCLLGSCGPFSPPSTAVTIVDAGATASFVRVF